MQRTKEGRGGTVAAPRTTAGYQRNVRPTVPRQKSKLLSARSKSLSGSLSWSDRKVADVAADADVVVEVAVQTTADVDAESLV